MANSARRRRPLLRCLLPLLLGLSGCADWEGVLHQEQSRYNGKPVAYMEGEWGRATAISTQIDGSRIVSFRKFRGEYACTILVRADTADLVTVLKVGGQNGCATP